jgi:hypothetical protein
VRSEYRDDRSSDFILDSEDIFKFSVVALGPAMRTGGRIDELASDANAITSSPYTTFQHVTDAEIAPNLPDVWGLALILEARIAGDDE